jgi:hypothetical protein
MQFRTQIPIPNSLQPISYNSTIVSLGSCFAVTMAEKFNYYKFQNSCNPFGILFHPLAIEKLVRFAVSEKKFTAEDVFFHNERWHCFDAHSDISESSKEELLSSLNGIIKTTKLQLQKASHVIITYGTSWVYVANESQQIVANCHKLPQKEFNKELLSIKKIQESISNTIRLVQSINPEVKFIFTVSPVRHIKDGFVENQLSKSHLIAAIHDSQFTIHDYFPSYEIMMDELRDYRFYTDDMLHPTQVAISYIWERFKDTFITEQARSTLEEVESIQKSILHRPFNPNSESHYKFLQNLNTKISKLVAKYPFMKF